MEYIMWALILGATLLASILGFIFLATRFNRFSFINRKYYGCIITIVLCLILFFTMGIMNMMIVILNLVFIWLICEFVAFIWRKTTKQKEKSKKNYRGAVAVLITVLYLAVGWYQGRHVWAEYYDITTTKENAEVKVALIADSHTGVTFDGEGFARHLEKIQSENPDILLIAGDFVDDDSNRDDMVRSCQALGEFDAKYGVYYVFGNHDKGYYGSEHRGFSEADLRENLKNNNVIILEDENVIIDNRINLLGRQDKSSELGDNPRIQMSELVADIDSSLYTIVMDHQPSDYENQKGLVDLVLSGHTHGGQLFPITYVGEWIGANDATYGLETLDGTDFIVTSGISSWAIKFKTMCRSEYVIIDIHN